MLPLIRKLIKRYKLYKTKMFYMLTRGNLMCIIHERCKTILFYITLGGI